MNYSRVTTTYAVAPQIDPADAEEIRAAGFTDVICNRPDEEVAPDQAANSVAAALSENGVRFHANPVRNGALTDAEVQRQASILAEAEGPVLAYCRSGTRSTIVWALGEPSMSPDAIIAAAAGAGYDLAPYRDLLERR